MKKIAYLEMLMLLVLCVGCGKETASVEKVDEVVAVTTPKLETQETASAIEGLTEEDFQPFFKALFGYSEDTFDKLNRNDEITFSGYMEDLNFYKEQINNGIGAYFSKSLKSQLMSESTPLDLDLPKKVKINDYVVEAAGKVEEVRIESSRESGENMIYEIAVTSTNKVMPIENFLNAYGWSTHLGYYAKKGEVDDVVGVTLEGEEPSPIYASLENGQDQIKVVSQYWIEVSEPEKSSKLHYQVEGLKQAGNFDVDEDKKQGILNSQYIERVPYYKEVADGEKKVIVDVVAQLFNASKERYSYYEKTFETSYEQFQQGLAEMKIADKLNLDNATYKQAFPITINPYKDNITALEVDTQKIQILPSLYSTQYQPAFVVSIPVVAQKKDQEDAYFVYKYFIRMENQKIEAIQFMKMESLTKASYEGFSAACETESVHKEDAKAEEMTN